MQWYNLQYKLWHPHKNCLGKQFSMQNSDILAFNANLNNGEILRSTTNCCVQLNSGHKWWGAKCIRPVIEMTVFPRYEDLYREISALTTSYAIRDAMNVAAFARGENNFATSLEVHQMLDQFVGGVDTVYFASKSHDPDFNQAISVYVFLNRNMTRRTIAKLNKFLSNIGGRDSYGFFGGVRFRVKSVLFLDNLIETFGIYQGDATVRCTHAPVDITCNTKPYNRLLQGVFELQRMLGSAWQRTNSSNNQGDGDTGHCQLVNTEAKEENVDIDVEQITDSILYEIKVPEGQPPEKAVETIRDYFSEQSSNHPTADGKAISCYMLEILDNHIMELKKEIQQPQGNTLSGVEV